MGNRGKRTAAALIVGACLLVGPASASAVVSQSNGPNGGLSLSSDTAGDNMSISCSGGTARWVEGSSNFTYACNAVKSISITGNAGNDLMDVSAVTTADFPNLVQVTLDGGVTSASDSDTIRGGGFGDTIIATSNDSVIGNGGGDTITGGGQVNGNDGDDTISNTAGPTDGGPGDDEIGFFGLGPYTGGPGDDRATLDYSIVGSLAYDLQIGLTDSQISVSVTAPIVTSTQSGLATIEEIDLALPQAGTQSVNATGFTGSLHVDGRGGPDTLIGGSGEDFLTGGPGDDTLEGAGGFDYLKGDAGADTLRLRDGAVDRGLCGTEADTVIADATDVLDGCESIDLPVVTDTSPPNTTGLSGPKTVTAGKKAKFRFTSTEAGSTFTCKLDKGKARKCTSPYSLKVSKPGKHTLKVTATDAAGNADPSPASRTFTVKAKKKRK